ncbi:hypothetical protein PF005_g3199 [Phytophthora fragariae]|uniref:Secreted protein n=1 Tax=Phytophthora fragariae TaxID=53985 RepID=A0A6A3TCF9_9STRA|nr:hypothetical protein PF003_g25843 [Phytophthora fragariae]KAE9026429.1 hypothetical protein PF011_g2576 [Phytophthora fragariae]KAE9133448.1 hypothetical protein PF010_g2836 [Phytophthora fragariae]KAE9134038.1 hypothetical protein PF007_g3117 [Phytophthora fragariae]KAE9231212.1 hypothetical protein PF005_g3199 [Phytophthora fragariae]
MHIIAARVLNCILCILCSREQPCLSFWSNGRSCIKATRIILRSSDADLPFVGTCRKNVADSGITGLVSGVSKSWGYTCDPPAPYHGVCYCC